MGRRRGHMPPGPGSALLCIVCSVALMGASNVVPRNDASADADAGPPTAMPTSAPSTSTAIDALLNSTTALQTKRLEKLEFKEDGDDQVRQVSSTDKLANSIAATAPEKKKKSKWASNHYFSSDLAKLRNRVRLTNKKLKNMQAGLYGEYSPQAEEEEEEKLPEFNTEPQLPASISFKHQPLVCVVISCKNAAAHVDQSIQSVVSQTYRNIKVVVVDDASEDGTQDAIDRWARNDTRIRVAKFRYSTLGGAGQANNFGLSLCTGSKYVSIIPGNDYMHKSMIMQTVIRAEAAKLDLVVTNYNTIDDGMALQEVTVDNDFWVRLVDWRQTQRVMKPPRYPDLFRLSPAPWRKLFNLHFLSKHNIRFPEGDYFYEDTTFHWTTMMYADRVGMLDEVLVFHRRENDGQSVRSPQEDRALLQGQGKDTDNSQDQKLGLTGILLNMNRIGKLLFGRRRGKVDPMILAEFFSLLVRTRWILQFRRRTKIQHKLEATWYRTVRRWYVRSPRWYQSNDASRVLRSALTKYRDRASHVDVSIVIPAFNSKEGVLTLLRYLAEQGVLVEGGTDDAQRTRSKTWSKAGRFEVIVVDDKSTDGLELAMSEFDVRYSNLYYLFHEGHPGAGRARNFAIPLIEGKYVYFLDADDDFNVHTLKEAFNAADRSAIDLLFLPYNLSMSGVLKPMFNADEKLWLEPKATAEARKQAAYGLINYPWNRLMKTEVILAGDVFFGGTVVHNDIQYHWDSITQASAIAFFPKPVCVHKKDPNMAQITNIRSEKRLAVTEAIRATDRVLETKKFFDGGKGKGKSKQKYRQLWYRFIRHILQWAEGRVPEEHMAKYQKVKRELTAAIISRDKHAAVDVLDPDTLARMSAHERAKDTSNERAELAKMRSLWQRHDPNARLLYSPEQEADAVALPSFDFAILLLALGLGVPLLLFLVRQNQKGGAKDGSMRGAAGAGTDVLALGVAGAPAAPGGVVHRRRELLPR